MQCAHAGNADAMENIAEIKMASEYCDSDIEGDNLFLSSDDDEELYMYTAAKKVTEF